MSLEDSAVRPAAPSRAIQPDFFVADIVDASFKDDRFTMEHPLFALKVGDRRIRMYEHRGATLMIKPGHDGCATIHDKDIWIYCVSQLVEAINRGRYDVTGTVRFVAYDFLSATGRQTSGRGYKLLEDALCRLKGTVVQTNIVTGGIQEKHAFGLIESWHIRKSVDTIDSKDFVEVVLPAWLVRSVHAMQVLTLSKDYFAIRKPMNRRIYELARKHCGTQPRWNVSIEVLYKKCGGTGQISKFRAAIKKLTYANQLPGYSVTYDPKTDCATFYSLGKKGHLAHLADLRAKFPATMQSSSCGQAQLPL